MTHFFIKRSALYRILLLDFIVVISILVLTIPLYWRILSSARADALTDYKDHATLAADQIDATVANLLNTLNNLHIELDINKLSIFNSESSDNSIYYTVQKAQQLMSSAFFAYDEVDEAVLLFRYNQIAISNRRSFFSRNEYFKNYIKWIDDMNRDHAEELTADFQHIRLLPSNSIMLFDDQTVADRLTYLLPVGQGESTILCAFLNTEALMQSFGINEVGKDAFLVMQDLKGSTLVSVNAPSGWETADKYERIEQTVSAFKCKVILGIPDSYFTQLIAPQRNLILMYSIIIALAGLFLATFAAYCSVLPIRKLVANLKLDAGKNQYEFGIIENAFHNLNQSYDQLVEAATRFESSRTMSQFGQMLFGSSFLIGHEQEIAVALPRLSAVHCVAVIRVDYSGEQAGENTGEIILTRITQALPEYEPIYPLSHSMLVVLLRSEETEIFARQIGAINEWLNIPCGAYVTAGVSKPDIEMHTLSRQFIQAMDNLSFVTEEAAVVFDHPKQNLTEYIPTFDGIRQMYDLLLTGAKDHVSEQLHKIQARMQNGIVTSQQKKQLYYCMDMMLSSVILEHGAEEGPLSMPPYDEAFTLDEIFASFEQMTGELCNYLHRFRICGNTELKERILKYIHDNYQNTDLYANLVADACKISVKYLHRVFHEYTGKSVCDYIEEKRMQLARQLLLDDQVNVSTIYIHCGFHSLNTFYKAFKRVHGVSPTDYRKLLFENGKQTM